LPDAYRAASVAPAPVAQSGCGALVVLSGDRLSYTLPHQTVAACRFAMLVDLALQARRSSAV